MVTLAAPSAAPAFAANPALVPSGDAAASALVEAGALATALVVYLGLALAAPADPLPVINAAAVLCRMGQPHRALERMAAAAHRFDGSALFVLRHVRLAHHCGDRAGAAALAELALAQHPQWHEVRRELAGLAQAAGLIDHAQDLISEVLAHCPDDAAAHNLAGNLARDTGDIDGAIAAYACAVRLAPHDPLLASNLLFSIHYAPGIDATTILHTARDWAERHAGDIPVMPPPARPRAPGPLRVGYVSPYFREHSASAFLLPLLARHDTTRFEVTCYVDYPGADAVTARYRALGHQWREVAGLDDAALAAQVRADGIDVLVDTAMHMQGSRLLMFARRPAPCQITWLAYPGTTGMDCFDARISDPWLDPPGTDADYSEPTWRLAHPFWCYAPQSDCPPVTPLPALASGHVTFGCLNNFHKVTAPTLDLWARTMAAVPGSHLIMLCPEGRHRERVLARFAAAGVAAECVHFVPRLARAAYLAMYGLIDVVLDTVPYHGHTTTLDGLWQGVPVVSLLGSTVVGRASRCILDNLGLGPLVARDADQFVGVARGLAGDLPGLAALRAGLRARMVASPLMDAAGFAHDWEAALSALSGVK